MDLYTRSVEKRGLRYDPYIGDGDSSSYREVCKAQVYGPTKVIGKEEDVCHVTKRMGTNLRALVRDYKGIFLILDNIYFLENIFFFHLIIYFT